MSQSEGDPSRGGGPEEATPGRETRTPGIRNLPLIIAWAVLVAVGGGYVCGLAICQFAALGSITLWPLGAVAGYVGLKIIGQPNRVAAWILVVACAIAFPLAEICWIRWCWPLWGEGQGSWPEAIALLPTFIKGNQIPALIAAIFTFFGAMAAYRQTAVRYRWVRVEER